MDISALLNRRIDTHTMHANSESEIWGMPEHSLIVEFLVRVMLDLKGAAKYATDAREWVADHERDEKEPFSLRWCAEHLNIEYEQLQGFLLDVADGLRDNDKLLNFSGIRNR